MVDIMRFDHLEAFFNWYMTNKPQRPPNGPILNYDKRFTEIILYRDGQFQVEMVVAAPNTEIPDHVHPGVDSYEVYISGDLCFRRDDESFTPNEPGVSHLRVLPEAYHGATVGTRGGVFLSIQHWTDYSVMPRFISDEWGFKDSEEQEKSKCST